MIKATICEDKPINAEIIFAMKGDTGNGIKETRLNSDYTLTIVYTDGTSFTTPPIRGEKGDTGELDAEQLAQLNKATADIIELFRELGLIANDIPTKVSELENDKGYLTEHQSLEGYATESWVEEKGYLTEHQSLEGYATQTWVENKGYLTEHQSLEGYTKDNELATVAKSGSYNDLTDTPEDVSVFNNDAGYLVADDVADKMERVVLYLSSNNNTYTLRKADNTTVNFSALYSLCRDESKYVVVLIGNSKLRPQYVSASEIHCDGEDRDSQGTMFLRMVMTPTTLYYGTFRQADKSDIPTNTEQLTNNSGFITRMVSDLANYYSKTEVDGMVSAIPKFAIEVVSALPTTNISATTVYLVKESDDSQNLYTEYIHVNNAWERLGAQDVDLTGYATESWVEGKGYLTEHQSLEGYATESFVAQEFARQLALLDGNGVAY